MGDRKEIVHMVLFLFFFIFYPFLEMVLKNRKRYILFSIFFPLKLQRLKYASQITINKSIFLTTRKKSILVMFVKNFK
ncbi:hypothetical protein C4N15_08940 [Fusobacterium necrophorum subsp. funduliforme]|nr:hypothetical protein C4N15_08940 [Fusobacterium necrophorum subsp. funduliforme]